MSGQLKNILQSFRNEDNSTESLADSMKRIAEYLLYNGYFIVNNSKKIFLRDIEFYYHEEGEGVDKIKDPIMYHTCDRTKNPDLEYYE